jgi:hypothetical protein
MHPGTLYSRPPNGADVRGSVANLVDPRIIVRGRTRPFRYTWRRRRRGRHADRVIGVASHSAMARLDPPYRAVGTRTRSVIRVSDRRPPFARNDTPEHQPTARSHPHRSGIDAPLRWVTSGVQPQLERASDHHFGGDGRAGDSHRRFSDDRGLNRSGGSVPTPRSLP